MQMRLYLEVRNYFVKNEDKNYQLFIKKDGTNIGTEYTDAFKILKDALYGENVY